MSRGLCRFSAPLLLISDPCFGAFAQGIARGLSARHDHGSQYMSDAFQQELAFLGIESCPPSCEPPRGMAVPSASSARSRRTCSGCAPSTPSRACPVVFGLGLLGTPLQEWLPCISPPASAHDRAGRERASTSAKGCQLTIARDQQTLSVALRYLASERTSASIRPCP